MDSALKGFAATLSPGAVQAVRRLGYVAFVEQDYEVALTTTQPNATWGLDRIDQEDLPLSTTYAFNVSGAGIAQRSPSITGRVSWTSGRSAAL